MGMSRIFSQPVFAQGTLFVATQAGGLYDLGAARMKGVTDLGS